MTRDLHHDHDMLRDLMHRFATTMKQGVETFDAVLHRERLVFSQLFNAHVAAELAMTRAALREGAFPVAAPVDLATIQRNYSAHISSWTPPLIKADWLRYRSAVVGLQASLTRRLDWEERELHPRLLQRRPFMPAVH